MCQGFEERSGLPVSKGNKFKLEIKVLPDRFEVKTDSDLSNFV